MKRCKYKKENHLNEHENQINQKNTYTHTRTHIQQPEMLFCCARQPFQKYIVDFMGDKQQQQQQRHQQK